MGRGGTPRQSSQSLGAQAFGQQSKANKPVQKSLAPYNPHAVKTRPDNGRPAAGWSGPGPAPEAGGLGGRAADRPAVAGNAPEPSNGHDSTASKATDFAAFLKKAPAPQGMRLPDQLNNGPKKEDIAALPTGQSVPYVRPADRVAMESAQDSQGGNVGGGNAALELIQRNKSHTAKAAAQIPFERKGGDGGRGPPHRNDRNDRSDRNERNGILNRNAHRNGGRERPSGNERAERGGGGGGGGDKGLGDRLALGAHWRLRPRPLDAYIIYTGQHEY